MKKYAIFKDLGPTIPPHELEKVSEHNTREEAMRAFENLSRDLQTKFIFDHEHFEGFEKEDSDTLLSHYHIPTPEGGFYFICPDE